MRLLKLAEVQGIVFKERPFTVDEARGAREAFITSSTNFVMPVTRIDGEPVANGHPGLLTCELREVYESFVQDAKVSA